MSKLRIPVAMAASVIALTHATASFADEEETATSTTTTTTAPVTTAQPVVVQPAATTTTTAAPYAPMGSDTTEKTVEKRPNSTLLSTGIGVFVVSYGASAVAAAVSDREADKNLFIPVVGPWIDLGNRDCGGVDPCGAREDINKAMIVTSGIVQGAGVLMALGSLIVPETRTVTTERTAAKTKPELSVSPVSFRGGAGIGAIGRF